MSHNTINQSLTVFASSSLKVAFAWRHNSSIYLEGSFLFPFPAKRSKTDSTRCKPVWMGARCVHYPDTTIARPSPSSSIDLSLSIGMKY